MTAQRRLLLVGVVSLALAAWGGHELLQAAFDPILKAMGS
jgi:hypothetical protein